MLAPIGHARIDPVALLSHGTPLAAHRVPLKLTALSTDSPSRIRTMREGAF